MAVDEAKLNDFLGQFVADLGATTNAAMVVIGTVEAAQRAGLTPQARVVSAASSGSDPVRMLHAGQHAIERVLERTGHTPDDLDVVPVRAANVAIDEQVQVVVGAVG